MSFNFTAKLSNVSHIGDTLSVTANMDSYLVRRVEHTAHIIELV